MRRGLSTAIAGGFAQLVLASPAVAQRVAMDTMSLQRLPGVFVEVDAVSEEARLGGALALAAMMRDSQPTFAPTWRSGPSLGTVPASRVSSITGLIMDATDRFISAHAVANRRRPRFEFSVRRRLQLPWSAPALRSGISKSKRLRPSTEIRP